MNATFHRIAAATFLIVTSCLPARAGDPLATLNARLRETRRPSVLFIGNSYSFDAPTEFRTYASNRGKKVRVEQVTNGGWTLAQHARNEKTLQKIREGHWDVVVIQEQSSIPSLPVLQRKKMMDPPLKKLVDEVRSHGAIPVLYQTWGYRKGNPKIKGDDFQSMTRRLREGYKAAAVNAGNVAVVPVGDAWEREFNEGKVEKLFQKDGSHPTKYGNQVTARAFYEILFPIKR